MAQKSTSTLTNFYPRPPRGGRPLASAVYTRRVDISIHALREEGDMTGRLVDISFSLFLSTPSARRATYVDKPVPVQDIFLSTPSARRATSIGCATFSGRSNFYPRPPRGGRPGGTFAVIDPGVFLSTPSARRATLPLLPLLLDFPISIHALREEGDLQSIRDVLGVKLFLSTPSARRATSLP